MGKDRSKTAHLEATRKVLEHVGGLINTRISVRLWDGSMVPLGEDVDPDYFLSINRPGILGSILKRPTLENVLLQYVSGDIDFHGGDIYTFLEVIRERVTKKKFRDFDKKLLLTNALPLVFSSSSEMAASRELTYAGPGDVETHRDNKEFVQFHYDLSNEFYQLFLDPEMVYSCAYFEDTDTSLAEAQFRKLDMICRKLQLKAGERFLDIGCGWGALICHAAQHYGVEAHGVTLSQKQFDYAQEKIQGMGLADRATIELRDYNSLEGTYDKISSIGMYEHVGIKNYPAYFGTINRLLRDRGLVLNHGIVRRSRASKRKRKKVKPLRRFVLKYVFPGSELDDIGHTIQSMEHQRFEIRDVESWREHYALTCKHWCKRLSANEAEAIRLIGKERYRMWVAYLAVSSFGFVDGSLRIYQTVAVKHGAKGFSQMPLTRDYLYA